MTLLQATHALPLLEWSRACFLSGRFLGNSKPDPAEGLSDLQQLVLATTHWLTVVGVDAACHDRIVNYLLKAEPLQDGKMPTRLGLTLVDSQCCYVSTATLKLDTTWYNFLEDEPQARFSGETYIVADLVEAVHRLRARVKE